MEVRHTLTQGISRHYCDREFVLATVASGVLSDQFELVVAETEAAGVVNLFDDIVGSSA